MLDSYLIQFGQSDLEFDLQSKGEITDDECAILVEQRLTKFAGWTSHCAIHKTTAIDNLRNGRQFCMRREKRKKRGSIQLLRLRLRLNPRYSFKIFNHISQK